MCLIHAASPCQCPARLSSAPATTHHSAHNPTSCHLQGNTNFLLLTHFHTIHQTQNHDVKPPTQYLHWKFVCCKVDNPNWRNYFVFMTFTDVTSLTGGASVVNMSTLASSSVILLELCTTVQLSWCWPAAVSPSAH